MYPQYRLSSIGGTYHTRTCDSLAFFNKSASRTDIKRGIRVLQLCGKLACHL